jgi:predicted RNA-binding Zn-ribbon protein involved in translation (DUF1610 family)
MDTLDYVCEHCDTELNGDARDAGTAAVCPACGRATMLRTASERIKDLRRAQGYGMAAAAAMHVDGSVANRSVVAIEMTGKRYKGRMALGVVALLVGIALAGIAGGSKVGGVLVVCGIVLYVAGRIGAWWNHG